MADIDTVDIDELLRSALKRVAEPGDPTGVAEAIRSRVDAGDTGTPAGPPSSRSWIPWVGAGLVVAAAGTALGASGLIGRPAPGASETVIWVGPTVSGLDCPAGTPVTTFSANDRVLATARSQDGAYLAVRDGYDYARTVWVPLRSVTLDSGDVEALPVDGCPEPVIARVTPDPAPEPAPAPQPEPGPQPAPGPAPVPVPVPSTPTPDTTPPTPQQWAASPTAIYCPGSGTNFPATTTVTLSAADNVAVTGATVSWSGAHSGSAPMTAAGGGWQYSYTAPAGASGTITFTVTARDAAGNLSSPRSIPVTVTCLI